MSPIDELNDEINNGRVLHEGSDDEPGNLNKPAQGEPDDDVGYGKPPKKSQFKKGTSGNPKGRPKGGLNFESQIRPVLREKVTVTENGRRRSITKVQAGLKQQLNKSAAGDRLAFKEIISLLRSVEDNARGGAGQISVSEGDQKIVEDFLKRCGNSDLRGGDNDPKSE